MSELPPINSVITFKLTKEAFEGGELVKRTIKHQGVVCFAGPVHFASGAWLGIELDETIGKNDGSVGGIRYFTCAPCHGLFVHPSTLISVDCLKAERNHALRKNDAEAPEGAIEKLTKGVEHMDAGDLRTLLKNLLAHAEDAVRIAVSAAVAEQVAAANAANHNIDCALDGGEIDGTEQLEVEATKGELLAAGGSEGFAVQAQQDAAALKIQACARGKASRKRVAKLKESSWATKSSPLKTREQAQQEPSRSQVGALKKEIGQLKQEIERLRIKNKRAVRRQEAEVGQLKAAVEQLRMKNKRAIRKQAMAQACWVSASELSLPKKPALSRSLGAARVAPLDQYLQYDLFLSYSWSYGQDEMRFLSDDLADVLPDANIFFDLDDLDECYGVDPVHVSKVVLYYLTDGYFRSTNCMREMLRACIDGKQTVVIFEPVKGQGGFGKGEVRKRLEQFYTYFLPNSKLRDEVKAWGAEMPTQDQLLSHLFDGSLVLEWSREICFSHVISRLIAARLAQQWPAEGDNKGRPAAVLTTLREIVHKLPLTLPSLTERFQFHVCVSPHNMGAQKLLDELKGAAETTCCCSAMSKLATSTRAEDAKKSRHMLVYLTACTWTSGDASSRFAEEVEEAMNNNVHIVLAHETPDLMDQGHQQLLRFNPSTASYEDTSIRFNPNTASYEDGQRHSCEFDMLFYCDKGVTPPNLIRKGLYSSVLIPLKGSVFREASLALLAAALSRHGSDERHRSEMIEHVAI